MRMSAFVVLLAAILAAPAIHAQTVITLDEHAPPQMIGKDVRLYLDRSGALGIAEIMSPASDSLFTPSRKVVPNFGTTRSSLWLTFTVRLAASQRYMLEIANPILDTIEFYRVHEEGVERKITGQLFPVSTRDFLAPNYMFDLGFGRDTLQTYYLRLKGRLLFAPLTIGTAESMIEHSHRADWFFWIYCGLVLMILAYNLLVYMFLREADYLYYSGWIVTISFYILATKGYLLFILPSGLHWSIAYSLTAISITSMFGVIFCISFLKARKYTPLLYRTLLLFLIPFSAVIVLNVLGDNYTATIIIDGSLIVATMIVLIISAKVYRLGYKPAKYYLLAFTSTYLSIFVYIFQLQGWLHYSFFTENSIVIGSSIEMILFSVALGYKMFTLREETDAARLRMIQIARENEQLVKNQNVRLEEQVMQRTRELQETNAQLQTTLANLTSAQAQIVQQEKLASLGQLTAGIAHEINNPLNFVNNFSSVCIELLDDLQQTDSENEKNSILESLRRDLSRINEHGKRADSIVKSMMMHVRRSTGERELTDLNALLEDAANLSWHGMRAQHKDFHVVIDKTLDPGLPKIPVVAQDINRAFLNIIHNALYAVHVRYHQEGVHESLAADAMEDGSGTEPGQKNTPRVWISSHHADGNIEIRIRDNGNGIHASVLNRIFEPFFTTKPAGDGTGLGLSMSYDSIVQQHGGTLGCHSEVGIGSDFIITLPVKAEKISDR